MLGRINNFSRCRELFSLMRSDVLLNLNKIKLYHTATIWSASLLQHYYYVVNNICKFTLRYYGMWTI